MNIRAKIFGGFDAAEEPLLPAKRPKGVRADQLDSVPVKRESRIRQDSRNEDRHRLVDERATVDFNGVSHEVELINLSGGGAMIAGPLEPMLWDHVDLHLGKHGTIECVVRWIRDGNIGLEFAHETRLDWPSDQVATVLRHVIERTFPHIAFPESDENQAVPRPAPAPAAEQKPRERESVNEHRAAPRHPLIWNGTLHHDFQSSAVRVRNISASGAMIETQATVRLGTEPLLELSPAVSLSATVEWTVGDQVGLRFHSPFDMNLLVESRPVLATPEWTPPPYLDPDAHQEVDESGDHWGRLDLYQLRQELEGFLKR
jgi:hypothetical protein